MIVAHMPSLMRLLGIVALVVMVDGCAGLGSSVYDSLQKLEPIARCPEHSGTSRPARVRVIGNEHLDTGLRKDVENALVVSVSCGTASYDPVTDQGRWAYWITIAEPPRDTKSRQYVFHLPRLTRKVTNHLLTDATIEARLPNVQDFDLDVLRADLTIPGESEQSFPCAETLAPQPRNARRAPSGTYIVERTYEGDVIVSTPPSPVVMFLPVRVVFEVHFTLPILDAALPSDAARAGAARRAEWVAWSDLCETCRPVVICEALRSTRAFQPRLPSEAATGGASNASVIHVMAGAERRPVSVDDVLALQKRTAACTWWTPVKGSPQGVKPSATDGSDEGLPLAAPYTIFHHFAKLGAGCWNVEMRLGELKPGPLPSRDDLLAACADGTPILVRRLSIAGAACP